MIMYQTKSTLLFSNKLALQHTLNMPRTNQGMTLLELLSTLTIVSILAVLATPSLYGAYLSNQSTANINKLTSLVRLARSTAITTQTTSQICPTLDGLSCQHNWHSGVMVFVDQNNNGKKENQEALVFFQSPFISDGTLQWLSLKDQIRFSAQGFPRGTIGSFIYCPNNKDEKFGRSLSLSFQGKLRAGTDSNNDHIVERIRGKNIACR
jgi:type IV fimbrial biogenesis protein FimT